MIKPLIIFFTAIFTFGLAAQSRTNLDIFYSLIDSSLTLLPDKIPGGSSITISPSDNSLIYNYINNSFRQKYIKTEISDRNIYISYAIEELELNYSNPFRKNFLGDFYTQRNCLVTGNFFVLGTDVKNFTFELRDTVKLDEVKSLENNLYPFTMADIPAEPFFQGIIEPVAAVTTAAAAVILFFILRSK